MTYQSHELDDNVFGGVDTNRANRLTRQLLKLIDAAGSYDSNMKYSFVFSDLDTAMRTVSSRLAVFGKQHVYVNFDQRNAFECPNVKDLFGNKAKFDSDESQKLNADLDELCATIVDLLTDSAFLALADKINLPADSVLSFEVSTHRKGFVFQLSSGQRLSIIAHNRINNIIISLSSNDYESQQLSFAELAHINSSRYSAKDIERAFTRFFDLYDINNSINQS